ncbi:MAG TPA: twin-arginine translocation signal domain-containing protein [Gammaproteobacteria bacterium]|nr:twin-arginine translocation signal domain-containing protein [Gammaproteobacteria bacterium]
MDNSSEKKFSRRTFIKSAALAAGAVAIPGLVFGGRARAANKLPKASVDYQDHPSGGKMCSGCMQFISGGSKNAMGACKVVQGRISPRGYCVAFVPKQGS